MLLLCAFVVGSARAASAQTQSPLTSEEFLQLVRQLPKNPGLKAQLVEALRERGIGFPVTSGLRSVLATKSGNDADLRRALEEAERRRLNPASAALPSEAEAEEVLAKAREAARAATEQMPDFVVKQVISRAEAAGTTRNWKTTDRLVVAVSFRAAGGEQYRLLAVNGIPSGASPQEASTYEQAGGSTSTGEFVSILAALFLDETQAKFKPAGTDTLGDRRTLVYEFAVEHANSRHVISTTGAQPITTAYRGRVWVDRENFRVLRLETEAVDIPVGYPIRGARRTIDYGWVTINERPYLLPAHSVVELTGLERGELVQSRNDIRFRNYQKYGTEVKIIEEDIIDEEPPPEKKKPQE
jgi:hypothetical protein